MKQTLTSTAKEMDTESKMNKQLCISIPTFNRDEYLYETLKSIENSISGFESLVEVRIYDNDSTDNTANVVQKFVDKYNWINYFKNPKNIGAHRNFRKSLRENTCDYVWVLGDDDCLVPNALKRIFEIINNNYSVIVLNYSKHTRDFSRVIDCREMKYFEDIILDKSNFVEFCDTSIGFISANIVKRELVSSVSIEYQDVFDDVSGCGFALCVYVAAVAGEVSFLISEPIIQQRCCNGYLKASYWVKHTLKYCDTLSFLLPDFGYSGDAIARYMSKRKKRDFLKRILSDIYRKKNVDELLKCAKPFFSNNSFFFLVCKIIAKCMPRSFVVAGWAIKHPGVVLE